MPTYKRIGIKKRNIVCASVASRRVAAALTK